MATQAKPDSDDDDFVVGSVRRYPRNGQDGEGGGSRKKRTKRRDYVPLSVHTSKKACEVALSTLNAYEYRYVTRSVSSLPSYVYRCVSHVNCEHYMRIKTITGCSTFSLEAAGTHIGALTVVSKVGISIELIDEVDAMLSAGAGPAGCRTDLQWKYRSNAAKLLLIPTIMQLKNRKAYLRDVRAGGWEMACFAQLLEWASGKMCETASAFYRNGETEDTFKTESPTYRNELLVLDVFEHEYVEDGLTKQSFGIIITSRSIFRNVQMSIEGQGVDGVVASADGTYRLHFGAFYY